MNKEKHPEEMGASGYSKLAWDLYSIADAHISMAQAQLIEKRLKELGYCKQIKGEWIEHPHFNFEGGYSGANYECSNCHYDEEYEKNHSVQTAEQR